MTPLTTKHVAVRIVVIIAAVEYLVMLVLRTIPHESGIFSEAALDATLLAVLSAPLIYIWLIKPFVRDRDEALAQVSHLALTDPLTQLPNRRLLLMDLKRLMAGTVRHKHHGALLLIDLDKFKLINDAFGHDAGDAVLAEFAKRLRSITRPEDVIGRLGGDEFVVLIDRLNTDERIAHNDALRIAEKLIELASKPFDFNGKTLHFGASIGIRLLGFENLDAETALSEADIAMYRAKQAGRGCAVFFES